MDVPVETLAEWKWLAKAASDRGDTRLASTTVERVLEVAAVQSPALCLWSVANTAIDISVNAGDYRFALEAAGRWSVEAQAAGRARFPFDWAYSRANLAEAQLCRGEAAAATALLDEADSTDRLDDLAINGLLLMRAWLLAHTGQAAAAGAVVKQVQRAPLKDYLPEYHYTRSIIARELGELDRAIAEAREGFAHAARASSQRNGFFALGSAALARRELDRGIAALEEFARHPYQGQSGPGLVLLAEAYEKLGRGADARQSYQWAVERDPESAAAVTARQRLG